MVVLDSTILFQHSSSTAVRSSHGDFNESSISATKSTHLHLENRDITQIGEINPCPRLQVLYLFDNRISKLENLDFCRNLTHLYLQNNRIGKIENMHLLTNLQKLFLSGNSISVLEGLEAQECLTELHLDHQSIPGEAELLVDPRTINAIKNSLTVLDISGNSLNRLDEFCGLSRLTTLVATHNEFSDIDALLIMLESFRDLGVLNLSENPFTKKLRYREKVMMACTSLSELDGKEVKEINRQFLLRMQESKTTLPSQHSQFQSNHRQSGSSQFWPSNNNLPGFISGTRLGDLQKSSLHTGPDATYVSANLSGNSLNRRVPSAMFSQQLQYLRKVSQEWPMLAETAAVQGYINVEHDQRYSDEFREGALGPEKFDDADFVRSSERGKFDDRTFPSRHLEDVQKYGDHETQFRRS